MAPALAARRYYRSVSVTPTRAVAGAPAARRPACATARDCEKPTRAVSARRRGPLNPLKL